MSAPKVSGARYVLNVVGVVLYIVWSWVLLGAAIVAGGLANVLIYDRVFLLCVGLTSAEQAHSIWATGLALSLLCYTIGVFQAARYLGVLPKIQAEQRERQRRARPEPVPEHERVKTGPSPEEIQRRGMPRG